MAPTTSSLPALQGAGLTVVRRDTASDGGRPVRPHQGSRRQGEGRQPHRAVGRRRDPRLPLGGRARRRRSVPLARRPRRHVPVPPGRRHGRPARRAARRGLRQGLVDHVGARRRGPLPARGGGLVVRVEHGRAAPRRWPDAGRRTGPGADPAGAARPTRSTRDCHWRPASAPPRAACRCCATGTTTGCAPAPSISRRTASTRRCSTTRHASPTTRLYRWEPVLAPVVVPRRAYNEGESQLRMVIRSTAALTVADYLAQPRVQGLGPVSGLAYLDRDDRWLVAPKTSQQMAELHGVFDDAIGSGDPARIQAAFDLAVQGVGNAARDGAGGRRCRSRTCPTCSAAACASPAFFQDPAIWPPSGLADRHGGVVGPPADPRRHGGGLRRPPPSRRSVASRRRCGTRRRAR